MNSPRWIRVSLLVATVVACGGPKTDDPLDSDGGSSDSSSAADGSSDSGGSDSGATDNTICRTYDVETCGTQSVCELVYGFPVLDRDGDGEWCVEKDDGAMALGCVEADAACGYSAAWRTPGEGDGEECYLFGSCTPSGWGNCPNSAQHITDPC